MSKRRKIFLGATAIALVAAMGFVVPTVWFKPYSANHLYARIFATVALQSPMMLSEMRLLPAWADFYSDDLDDRSVEFRDQQARWTDRQLDILRSYDRRSVGDSLSYDILEWFMADLSEASRFRYHNYPLNQMNGEQSSLPSFMLETHQILSERDARNYVSRLQQFDRYYYQLLEDLRIREERGLTPPRFVIERVLNEMREFITPAPSENVLYEHLRSRLDSIPSVSTGDREAILSGAETALSDQVYAAYDSLIAYAESLQPITSTDDGVWRLPNGDAYYSYLLRQYTTTDLTAEEIHQLGLREVDQIESQMRAILESEGYAPGDDIGATLEAVYHEPRFQWPEGEAGETAIVAEYQRIIDDVQTGLGPLFGIRPRVGVTVERIPEFKEAGSALAYYNPPSIDGARPGVFFVNLRDTKEHTKPRMRTLAYHEAIPGHHFQIGIAQEITGVPFFRRVIPFTAFAEGWALYAEQVAAEHGFQDDPYSRLGYLRDQMLRACRLVVDTGIRSKRWTREQAIAFMRSKTGMPIQELTAEVERYVVLPGQATSYTVGRLKILELRERAHSRLGDKFELREFHDVVLRNGAVPLAILERIIDDWIASEV